MGHFPWRQVLRNTSEVPFCARWRWRGGWGTCSAVCQKPNQPGPTSIPGWGLENKQKGGRVELRPRKPLLQRGPGHVLLHVLCFSYKAFLEGGCWDRRASRLFLWGLDITIVVKGKK